MITATDPVFVINDYHLISFICGDLPIFFPQAKEKQRIIRHRKASKWAVDVLEDYYIRRKVRTPYLVYLFCVCVS